MVQNTSRIQDKKKLNPILFMVHVSGPMKNCPFSNAVLTKIAAAHNASVAQVCLRWVLDRGCTIAVGTGNDPAKASVRRNEVDPVALVPLAAQLWRLWLLCAVQAVLWWC